MDELQFFIPSRIYLGQNSLSRVGSVAEKYGVRALLVSDSSLLEMDLRERLAEILGRKGIRLILAQGVDTTATGDFIEEILSLARASRTEMIISLGGIRTLSVAKAASALYNWESSVDDLLDGELPDLKQIPKLPYIEIPTTCRNPFMLNNQFLILDGRNMRNRIMEVTGSIPDAVIMEPQLGASLSQKYTLSTLLDSFLYALEGYLSLKNNFFSDSLFLKSLSLLDSALEILDNPEYTDDFLNKTFQAGLCASVGLSMSRLGVGAALAFALGGRFELPKSLVAAMMIPTMLEYGALAAPDKMARVAVILEPDTRKLPPSAAAVKAVEIMRIRLGKHIGELRIPNLKIPSDEMTDLAEFIHTYPMIRDLPGALSSKDIRDMIRRTF
ncbi:MAG: iron-containing alcohol dehydrogenase [Spirochaetales bacterium]|jgi:alcohol dehydrogenase|nr:iron-containing alcohol dehydrogenase [Spirochaetales bacterium]